MTHIVVRGVSVSKRERGRGERESLLFKAQGGEDREAQEEKGC